MATPTFTKSGNKATTAAKLDKAVFGLSVESHQLLKDAYVAYLSNGRVNLATTKKRGEVRGGGRKPWRQKGTGRARFGSSRNPIWRGGGVTFGPSGEENYKKKLNTAAKRTALRQALSLASDAGKVSVIESFAVKSGKTKEAAALLAKVGAKGNVLVVIATLTPELSRGSSNLGGVKLVQSGYLNVYDILNADLLLIEQAALESISKWLGGKQ